MNYEISCFNNSSNYNKTSIVRNTIEIKINIPTSINYKHQYLLTSYNHYRNYSYISPTYNKNTE